MKTYKYFHKSDPKKEAIGKVKANSPDGARAKASEKKKLRFFEFTKLFGVEEIEK